MADIHSLSPTLDQERTANPLGVGLIWLAATMTASTLPLGALIAELFPDANFIIVITLAAFFFITVGIISLPGFQSGIPTMAISARIFGGKYNKIISLSNWLSQVGWQSVVLLLVIFVLRSMINYFHLADGRASLDIAIVLAIIANFTIPIIGYEAIVKAQTGASLIMGLFAFYILWHLHGFSLLWLRSFSNTHNSWMQTLAALSLALMGGALSWTMFAADYSRFLNRKSRSSSVIFWPSLGGALGGTLILSLAFVLYFSGGVGLTNSGLQITVQGLESPILYVSFCTFAILGLLASNFLNSYSSAFSLAVTIGKDINRKQITVIDASLATVISLYILFISPSFLQAFQTFLDLLIIVAAPWTGIVCAGIFVGWNEGVSAKKNSTLSRSRMAILLVGMFATAIFSNNPLWEGFGARMLGGNDISPLVGFFFGLTAALIHLYWHRQIISKKTAQTVETITTTEKA